MKPVDAVARFSALGMLLAGLCARAEVPPAQSIPCFPGAYYRKAVSSQDTWTGIEGVVTLPEFTPDEDRRNPDNGRYLDSSSIYMGGQAGNQEIDAGVNWERIKEADGSISKVGKAYRPFWRNKDWHSGPAKPDFYYYPGDQLRMRIETLEANKLTMTIELLARGDVARQKLAEYYSPPKPAATPVPATDSGTTETTATAAPETTATATVAANAAETTTSPGIAKEVVATAQLPAPGANTASYGKDFAATAPDAMTSLSVTFDAPNFGPGRLQEFKRVNAIDQVGNEGKGVTPTKARVTDSTWMEVYLLRGRMRVPMSSARYTDMRCPDAKHFTVFNFGNSNERICIRGGAK